MSHHKVNLPIRLRTVLELPLDTAVEKARQWWQEHHLLEDLDTIAFDARTDRILLACQHLDISDFSEVLERAEQIICTATGAQHLTRYTDDEESDLIHGVRNHLGAMLAAVAQSAGKDPDSTSKYPDSTGEDPEPALRALPDVAPRAGGHTRPCRDDEILLMRQRFLYGINLNGRHRLVACQYALVETGAWPSETTTICPRAFKKRPAPTTVKLPGVTHTADKRTVPLPKWARPGLTRALGARIAQSQHALDWPLMYSGSHSLGGNQASASASGNLGRAMLRAGLTKDRPQPVSILRWRAEVTLHDQGARAACALLGKTEYEPLFDFIGRTDPSAVRAPKERLLTYMGY